MLPTISIIIPTYNSEKTFFECLNSIKRQNYPKDKLEILVIDAGSTDDTLKIAKKFRVNKILSNPLKTGEAGKAVGIKHAKNEIVALIDSDNILPNRNWLSKMVEPFEDKEITGTEPLYYWYRKKDSLITRYSALIGANDPLCIFLGNYDRYSFITSKWTGMLVETVERKIYIRIKLNEKQIPTIGANGFLVRRKPLLECSIDNYFFDIDVVWELVKNKNNVFAKVKTGIVHIFSGDIWTFVRKQKRRVKDFMYYKKLNLRKYPWSNLDKFRLLKFVLYSIFIIPLLIQAIIGYFRKKDLAWIFHVPACLITLFVYSFMIIKYTIIKPTIESRKVWSQ